MGYIPPPRPPYPMTRNPVPTPPSPRNRFKKDDMNIEIIVRDYDGQKFVKYSNSDGYHMMKLSKHGKLDDVMGEELDALDALVYHAEQEKMKKAKLEEDAEKQKMAHEFYAPYVPLINDKMKSQEYQKFIKYVVEGKEDSAKKQMKKIILQKVENAVKNNKIEKETKPWFPPNRLINESTGEVTYDYKSEEQKRQWPQLKKDAGIDSPKNKQKEEPKPEYGEAVNIRKKKSRWQRFIDRIIKNIVWGK